MPGQPVRSNRQAKAVEEARIAAETMRRRLEQRNAIGAATKRVEDAIASVSEKRKKCERLASHLAGFYEEVDKLAKGKALLEARDLIVEHANNIVRESKALIQGDPYLDQIKEFVPAGNNPVYPDVLWVARAVQQAVERYGAELRRLEELLEPKLLLGKTILAALQWFHGSYGSEEFSFTRLDNRDIVAYLSDGIATLPDGQQ